MSGTDVARLWGRAACRPSIVRLWRLGVGNRFETTSKPGESIKRRSTTMERWREVVFISRRRPAIISKIELSSNSNDKRRQQQRQSSLYAFLFFACAIELVHLIETITNFQCEASTDWMDCLSPPHQNIVVQTLNECRFFPECSIFKQMLLGKKLTILLCTDLSGFSALYDRSCH